MPLAQGPHHENHCLQVPQDYQQTLYDILRLFTAEHPSALWAHLPYFPSICYAGSLPGSSSPSPSHPVNCAVVLFDGPHVVWCAGFYPLPPHSQLPSYYLSRVCSKQFSECVHNDPFNMRIFLPYNHPLKALRGHRRRSLAGSPPYSALDSSRPPRLLFSAWDSFPMQSASTSQAARDIPKKAFSDPPDQANVPLTRTCF